MGTAWLGQCSSDLGHVDEWTFGQTQDPLPLGSEFRVSMPYIPCGDATSTLKTRVDIVGYSAASVYIAVIPLCLLYLLLRLRNVLQASATTTWASG